MAELIRHSGQQDEQAARAAVSAAALPHGANWQDIREARLCGMREGLEEGTRAGRDQVLSAVRDRIERERAETEAACTGLAEQTRQELAARQDGLPAAAVREARRTLDEELHRGDQPFLRLFAQAAAHVGRAEHAVLRASPYGCGIASRYLEWMKKQIDGLRSLELRQTPGDDGLCILETEAGSVDASVETQFRKAMRLIGFPDGQTGGDRHAAAGH